MSQQLEFRISARDQASSVVTSVQKKVLDFGKDIGRSIGAALGPIALVTMAVQKIGEVMEQNAQARKDAFDWGADLEKSAGLLGVTVEQMQAIEMAAENTGRNVEEVGKAFKLAADLIASAKAGNEQATASLRALGFDISKLNELKPQDVIRALAGAMATVEDPAKKGELAIAALGKEAKNLQAVLEKGFDFAAAFENVDGLSKEEARNLRELQKEERARANREKLAKAREESTKRAIESGDQEIIQAAIAKGGVDSAGNLAANPEVQAAGREILRRRQAEADQRKAKEDAQANIAAGGATPEQAAENLRKKIADDAARAEAEAKAKKEAEEAARKAERAKEKAAEDALKPIKTAKPKKEDVEAVAKTAAVTVSSLRAIGGGIAGEQVGQFDVQQMQLDVQKQMRDLLQDIKGNLKPPTDFSKPVIDGMTDYSGKSGVGVA